MHILDKMLIPLRPCKQANVYTAQVTKRIIIVINVLEIVNPKREKIELLFD